MSEELILCGDRCCYTGGCHCEAVRFQIEISEAEHKASECNCSICRKKGFLHLIVPLDRFTLVRGGDVLTTYTFNTGVAKHTFCRICGIQSFYQPRSHPTAIDVNVRCLDGDVLSRFQVEAFDGANWEQNVHRLPLIDSKNLGTTEQQEREPSGGIKECDASQPLCVFASGYFSRWLPLPETVTHFIC